MRRAKWVAFGVLVAYFLFYLGGSYSFSYTHVCARSHVKVFYVQTHDNAVRHTTTVCDAYGGNSKHWSPGDPVRALYSESINRWNGGIVVLIALVIGGAVFYDRWKQRRERPPDRATPFR